MEKTMCRLFALILFAFPFATPVHALDIADVILSESVQVGGKDLVLNGAGIRKATIFGIRVYVGALYLTSKTNDVQTILNSPEPKQIILHFVRSVGKEKLQDAWKEAIDKNAPNPTALETPLNTFNAMMEDVDEGSSIVLSFLERKVSVLVNGVEKGEIEGDEFTRGLLLVWLGKYPPNEDLKSGMLGLS